MCYLEINSVIEELTRALGAEGSPLTEGSHCQHEGESAPSNETIAQVAVYDCAGNVTPLSLATSVMRYTQDFGKLWLQPYGDRALSCTLTYRHPASKMRFHAALGDFCCATKRGGVV